MHTVFSAVHFDRRAAIFVQGDACDSVMVIEHGLVRLSVTSRSGQEGICGLLATGAFLGEEAMRGERARHHTATALTATEVLVVAKADMLALIHTQQAIQDRFIAHVIARHTRLEADLSDQLLHSSGQRIARALLVLAGCAESRSCRCVLPSVSQEIIAEMVGTTRSRVNVFMGLFKKRGLIEDHDGVLRISPSLLHAVEDSSDLSQRVHT